MKTFKSLDNEILLRMSLNNESFSWLVYGLRDLEWSEEV